MVMVVVLLAGTPNCTGATYCRSTGVVYKIVIDAWWGISLLTWPGSISLETCEPHYIFWGIQHAEKVGHQTGLCLKWKYGISTLNSWSEKIIKIQILVHRKAESSKIEIPHSGVPCAITLCELCMRACTTSGQKSSSTSSWAGYFQSVVPKLQARSRFTGDGVRWSAMLACKVNVICINRFVETLRSISMPPIGIAPFGVRLFLRRVYLSHYSKFLPKRTLALSQSLNNSTTMIAKDIGIYCGVVEGL